ncbi:type II secretion system protein G [Elusimicrobium posterum]|uniref:type IV pilin protein n=1 Tax=Elusimicrobium posterum TaxID=3116653 RepID=UPI003C792311
MNQAKPQRFFRLRNSGFTLIELLVVVLIIGILAAIALPQYQKAVQKARLAEAVLNLGIMEKAVERYLLQEGGYPSTSSVDITEDLDITPPARADEDTQRFSYTASCNTDECFVYADAPNYFLEIRNIGTDERKAYCVSPGDGAEGKKICKLAPTEYEYSPS